MNSKKTTLKLSERIFWDAYLTSMDTDAKYAFVIERVFERGDIEVYTYRNLLFSH